MQLAMTPDRCGLTYRLVGSEGTIHPDRWALVEPDLPAAVRRALRQLAVLLEQEQARTQQDGSVLVPHSVAASLSPGEAASLELPQAIPFTLHIESYGRVDEPTFRIGYRWFDSRGRAVFPGARQGCLLPVGQRSYRLPEPFYSLLEAIDQLNTAPPQDLNERFLAVGRIREMVPEGTPVDGYLGTTRVVRASAFTLDGYVDENGEFTFDPVLMRPDAPRVRPGSSDADDMPPGAPRYVPSLPPDCQRSFASQFRRRPRALSRYVPADRWYVFLDEPLQRALELVRRKQEAPEAERRAFFANPLSALREDLGAELQKVVPDGQDLEEFLNSLFVETASYGERVQGIGPWAPKVIPWVVRPPSPWLPPEEVGVMVGEERITVSRQDLSRLRQELQEAIARGKPSVSFHGQEIPATPQALEAVRTLEDASQRPMRDTDERSSRQRLVLIIADNLEHVAYAPQPRPHGGSEADIEGALATSLKPHQQAGLEWLRAHWIRGSHGALLADDMGLGKTLQALAFLTWVKQQMEAGCAPRAPILVVAPTGLLKNWEAEHDRHLKPPGLGFLVRAYGEGLREIRRTASLPRGAELASGGAVLDSAKLREADWVLTTYETLRDYQHSFGLVRWAVVVFDEAQKIKTPGTLMTEAAKAVQAEFVLAMTGTPVENRLADLWCIVDTVQPALLGDLKTFSRTYEKADNEAALRELKQKLDQDEPEPPPRPKVLLRRLKSSHLKGLPPKHEHVLRAPMPAVQAERYAKVVELARRGASDRQSMLATIHRLRSVSLHPLTPEDGISDEEYIASSARLAVAIRVLDEVARVGERALVYVDSLEFQSILQGLLQRRYRLAQPPLLINGTVAGDQRKRRVDAFQEGKGFEVMILSPRAGGVGLTLTAATHVIHLSRWWNPAVEDQCTDRVYRIGQTRPVHVYFPMAEHPVFGEHSFDVQLDALIRRKRQLSHALLSPGDATDEDLRQLFEATVRQPSSPAP